jgi:hypothetical protein
MPRQVEGGKAIPVAVVDPETRQVLAGAALPVANFGSPAQTIQFDTDFTGPLTHSEGLVYWNNVAGTLDIMTDIEGVVFQVGEESQIKVFNDSGDLLQNGKPVYISGINGGGFPTVELAQANSFVTSLVLGLVTADIPNGFPGRVTAFGNVREINTLALSTGPVFLSSTVKGGLVSDEPVPPASSVRIGQVLTSDAEIGEIFVNVEGAQNPPQTIAFSMPLRGVTASQVNLTGEFRTVSAGVTGDFATDFAVSNNHIFLLVNSITGTGDVTITGTSISETTSLPVIGATETITIDASTNQYYQSSEKWWEVTNLDIPPGISAIDYDIGVVGYSDINNQNFELLAYRLDMVAQGNTPDIRFRIIKIQDDGNGKMSLIDVEDIGVDSGAVGNQIIDGLRTGGDDRSYNPAVATIWDDAQNFVFKQGDFSTYFVADENMFNSGDADEGMIIRFEGSPSGGITNVDFAVLQLRYRPI